MATINFEIELINETNGQFMNFEYEYEVYEDMSEDELRDMADDLASGSDPDLYREIMDQISIVPRVLSIETE